MGSDEMVAADEHSQFVLRNAGAAIMSGTNNTMLGTGAGTTTTTGSGNIMIGYGVNAPAATDSNTLNIGNTIYGLGPSGRRRPRSALGLRQPIR